MPKSDREILSKFVPEKSVDFVLALIVEYEISLNIKKARASKLGDFKAPVNGLPPRLSINGDLNKYAFLITLVHEIAHWMVWRNYKNYRHLQPHGSEWKQSFQELMQPFLTSAIFPDPILKILQKHMLNPKASTTSDIHLLKVLKEYDKGEKAIVLADLEIGSSFELKGRQCRILKKNRSRFLCVDIVIGKKYMVHSLAEITPIN
ncbi:MAG: sprT domain-containing protein [Bacteroidales bacterium]|nr:sprT domain-containing protein [Bacteroidales bacterium]